MMRSPKRLLLVEDFEDSRTGLTKLLEIEGYEVLEAADGAQAIELAVSSKPDLILMDLTLPVIDGLSAAKKIKASKGLEEVPIIALTAHDQDDVQQLTEVAGCVDFVSKPVNFSALMALLAKYLPD